MDLDESNLTLSDPTDFSILNVQPIQSIRVWGVGRDNGRCVLVVIDTLFVVVIRPGKDQLIIISIK